MKQRNYNHPSITKVKKCSGMALKKSYHPNNMTNKIKIYIYLMRLTHCERKYAIFCSVFMAFNTSSESNPCIGRIKDGEHNHHNIKEHAQRPFSSLLSVNQYTDLAILFFSNCQPSMECG
jgi:hypothetical protein